MIYAGKNILNSSDRMVKVNLDYLYHSIRSPKSNIIQQLRQLQSVREISPKRYEQLKHQLPYFVTASFNPPVRNVSNFAYIEYFIIDIDDLTEKGVDIESLRESLIDDPRVVMLFLSQGGNGFKIVCRLSERCYDDGIFSVFVKEFARIFCLRHNLSQHVNQDMKSVTYACYISSDEKVYYNPEAVAVQISDYIDIENPFSFFDLKKKQEEEDKLYEKERKSRACQDDDSADPDDETLGKIKGILLGDKYKPRREPKVAKELDDILEGLVGFIENQGIDVYRISNANTAKKLECMRGNELAEVNLFFGTNGFNVVQSPRCLLSESLNDVLAEIIRIYIANMK